MGDLQEALLQAIDSVASRRAEQKQCNITIECQISSIVDSKIIASFMGNSFEVFPICKDNDFQVNDFIYVIVPNSDFNKKKFILGKI